MVILAYVSSDYLPHLLNWLVALRRLNVTNVAIFCRDEKLRHFLAERGTACFDAEQKFKIDKVTSRTRIRNLWVLRLRHLIQILSSGVDVVLSDVDAIWIKNPFNVHGASKSAVFDVKTFDIAAGRGTYPGYVAKDWDRTS